MMDAQKIIKFLQNYHQTDHPVCHLVTDSRRLNKGDIFVAIRGEEKDGHDYIDDVIDKGAFAIIADENYPMRSDVYWFGVSNSRKILAQLAGFLWDDIPDICMAVTGTNGKSSVAGFVSQILSQYQKSNILLGTLGMFLDGKKIAPSLTTPDSITLHKTLQWSKQQGAEAAIIEASSHGLKQNRLDGLKFDGAAFTNFSRDHLDYHGDMEDYFQSKMHLFKALLKKDAYGVVYGDDDRSEYIVDFLKKQKVQTLTYGRHGTLMIEKIIPRPEGQDVVLSYMGQKYAMLLPLIGAFQVENVACAALMAMLSGVGSGVFDHLDQLRGIAGRMQYIGQSPSQGHVYVDYAHTPGAIENILKNVRSHTQGQLKIILGAGGNRDQGKRPLMGKAASDYADMVYITDDNPRDENPQKIRDQIAQGAPQAVSIGDRYEAIQRGIDDLNKGDILIITGKGHEEGQIIGDEILPFNDANIAGEILGKSHDSLDI